MEAFKREGEGDFFMLITHPVTTLRFESAT